MAGSLSYLIFDVHPAALLEYIQVLESWPMDKGRLLEVAQPYPKSLLRTVSHHMDHDPHHLAELNAVIKAVPKYHKLIADVAIMTRNYIHQAALAIAA